MQEGLALARAAHRIARSQCFLILAPCRSIAFQTARLYPSPSILKMKERESSRAV
jgi:hypothetical protein